MDNKGVDGRPASWVITCLASGEVFEIFGEENAEKCERSNFWKVETAVEYLARINRLGNRMKNDCTRCTGSSVTQICPQRHTCQRYIAHRTDKSTWPVSVMSMPESAGEWCYAYIPVKAVDK